MNLEQRQQLNTDLQRLARGDRTAAQPVFTLVWPVLKGYCFAWLRSPEAEDAAQQALLKLFSQAPHFDARRDALAWALELASWECRTQQKARARDRSVPLENAAGAAAEPTADTALEAADLSRAVNEVAAQLSPTDRGELERVLREELAGNPAARKRRQRALERFAHLWRTLHADH